MRQVLNFLLDIYHNRWLMVELTKQDFKARYLGSYLGILWAFIQPLITVLIFWFVFQVGFKAQPVSEVPFILWLITGMFIWFFFSDSVNNATNSIIENSYLVKKVVFRVSLLPMIKICSALVIHIFFIGILLLMFLIYGQPLTIYAVQVVYYLFAAICLALGIGWITASLVVFARDFGQVVAMLLQFAFWMTPVFWSSTIVPDQYQMMLKLNPAYYLVEGYRNCFVHHIWFWQQPLLTIYFWGVTVLILVIGVLLFKRLRSHFADVI